MNMSFNLGFTVWDAYAALWSGYMNKLCHFTEDISIGWCSDHYCYYERYWLTKSWLAVNGMDGLFSVQSFVLKSVAIFKVIKQLQDHFPAWCGFTNKDYYGKAL